MISAKAKRSGITLIEIVAVLGLLLMLAAMLVPFLARVRLSAARSQGMNNLRQIVLSVHNYADQYRRIPPTVGNGVDGRHSTILYHLLPFIEQGPLYNRGSPWEAGTIDVVVPTYIDPRDPTAPPGHKYQGWLATTNYAANWLAFKNVPQGFPAAFPDGTSNTIAFTQRYQVCNDMPCAWAYDRLYHWAPMIGYYSVGKFQTMPQGAACDPAVAQAFDEGGILLATADGAVHTVNDRVSPQTWHHALTPDGGEPIGQDFFD